MSDITTVQEYVISQVTKFADSDKRIIELYKEQQKLESMRAELEAREKSFEDRLRALGPYADKNFKVTDLRETRVPDMDLLNKNFHDIWEKSIPDDKYLMECLKSYMGSEKICGIVRAMNEEEYDRQRKITLAEFDKAAGDSSAKKKYVGTAYHLKFTPTKKTRIESLYVPEMMKFPSGQKRELIEPEDDE